MLGFLKKQLPQLFSLYRIKSEHFKHQGTTLWVPQFRHTILGPWHYIRWEEKDGRVVEPKLSLGIKQGAEDKHQALNVIRFFIKEKQRRKVERAVVHYIDPDMLQEDDE